MQEVGLSGQWVWPGEMGVELGMHFPTYFPAWDGHRLVGGWPWLGSAISAGMSASERVVVVLGGAGTVGSGIVRALLERGFQVAVVSRDGARLEKLKSFVPAPTRDRLHTLLGDVGSEEGAEAAKGALLKSVGKVTDVVSALGFSWWQGGPPHTQTLQELTRVLETLLLSTFAAWKAFFPLVRENPGGSYTFITGGAGERLLMPGTGFLTLGAASVLAFCRVVREEYPDVPCKLNELKINMGVVAQDPGRPGYVSHLEVGAAVAALLEKGSVSHAVLCAGSPADLQALAREGTI
ncbi:L-fucose dehydrogenase-like isoform X1 [Pelodiscus sinensis]|uniref:L-fucose dehydrogenase-like isoform X1 n=1 Tax=Pelodiscus sinensis TaxID=13735 RepID=UPI003F6CA276